MIFQLPVVNIGEIVDRHCLNLSFHNRSVMA